MQSLKQRKRTENQSASSRKRLPRFTGSLIPSHLHQGKDEGYCADGVQFGLKEQEARRQDQDRQDEGHARRERPDDIPQDEPRDPDYPGEYQHGLEDPYQEPRGRAESEPAKSRAPSIAHEGREAEDEDGGDEPYPEAQREGLYGRRGLFSSIVKKEPMAASMIPKARRG